MTVAKNIKQFRQSNKMTQDQLAEKIHTTRQTISNYETGKSEPDIQTLELLAEALNCEVTELIYGKKKDIDNTFVKYSIVQIIITIILYFTLRLFAMNYEAFFILSSPYETVNQQAFYLIITPIFAFYISIYIGRLIRVATHKITNDIFDKVISITCLLIPIIYTIVSIIYLCITTNTWIQTENVSDFYANLTYWTYTNQLIAMSCLYLLFIILGIGEGFTYPKKVSYKKGWIPVIVTCVITCACLFMSYAPIATLRVRNDSYAVYSTQMSNYKIIEYTCKDGEWYETYNTTETNHGYSNREYIQLHYAYKDNQLYVNSDMTFAYHIERSNVNDISMNWKSFVWISNNESLLAVNDIDYINKSIEDIQNNPKDGLKYITIQYDEFKNSVNYKD